MQKKYDEVLAERDQLKNLAESQSKQIETLQKAILDHK